MKPTFNQIQNHLGEIQQTHNWIITVVKTPSAVGSEIAELLKFRAQSATMPSFTHNTTTIELFGHQFSYIGQGKKNGSQDFTIVETIDAKVAKFMMKLAKTVHNSTGNDTPGGALADTKDVLMTIDCQLLNHKLQPAQIWRLERCLITSFNPGANFSQNQGAMNSTLSLTYDDYHWGPGSSLNV